MTLSHPFSFMEDHQVPPLSMPLSSKSKQSILCWPRLCVHRHCLKLLFIWHAIFQDSSHLWWLHCPPVYLLGCFPWLSNVIHMSNSKYTYLYFCKSSISNIRLLTNPEPTPGLGIFNLRINLNAKVRQALSSLHKRWLGRGEMWKKATVPLPWSGSSFRGILGMGPTFPTVKLCDSISEVQSPYKQQQKQNHV